MNHERFDAFPPKPIVSFPAPNIMYVDGKIIEAPDTTPQLLKDTVVEHEAAIRQQIATLEGFNEAFSPSTTRHLRATILISRLALSREKQYALTEHTLNSGSHHFNTIDVLTDDFMPYWSTVAEAGFRPEVHVLRHNGIEVNGVWLGISPQ